MTNHGADTLIIADQQAEGSRQSADEREPISPTLPAMSMPVRPRRSPTAETGVVAAVVLSGEGTDDRDTQDASRTAAETQTAPMPQPALQATAGMRALIIEDTVELADVLQITLRRMQMVTVHETNGGRALTRFGELNPDLILLDIGLPDIPGWKVLENMKEHRRETGGKMPVIIVITAYGDPANRLVGKLHDVYKYLIKPFTPREIERVVRDALSTATE